MKGVWTKILTGCLHLLRKTHQAQCRQDSADPDRHGRPGRVHPVPTTGFYGLIKGI